MTFSETINKIKEICCTSESCADCVFGEEAINQPNIEWCYFELEPGHEWDAHEILNRIEAGRANNEK